MAEHSTRPEQHAGVVWAQQAWLWPLEATRIALQGYAQWFADQNPALSKAEEPPPLDWTTPNTVALQLQTMRLREFSRGNRDATTGAHLCALCAARRS